MKYVRELLARGSIHEFHAWNFTRNDADDAWLRSLHDPESGVHVMPVQNKLLWREYYQYYRPEFFEDCVIIKSDDDIVYIDLDGFDAFVALR